MSRNARLVLGVLLIAAAAWLVDAMRLAPRAASQESEGARVDALLASRAAFERSLLEARAGLQSSFDPLNRAVAALREAGDVAGALRARGAAHAAAAERLDRAARALESLEGVVEQFKTDLALLRLSSRHFPLAADALLRRADADVRAGRRSALAGELATLAALRTDVRRLQELPAPEHAQRLEQGLSRLQAVRAALDEAGREELDMLSGHARAIIDRRERVDRLVRELVHSPLHEHLAAARSAHGRSERRRARQVGALQMLSGVLALGGLLVLASAAVRSARERGPRAPASPGA